MTKFSFPNYYTARAGRNGLAVTLATNDELKTLNVSEKFRFSFMLFIYGKHVILPSANIGSFTSLIMSSSAKLKNLLLQKL